MYLNMQVQFLPLQRLSSCINSYFHLPHLGPILKPVENDATSASFWIEIIAIFIISNIMAITLTYLELAFHRKYNLWLVLTTLFCIDIKSGYNIVVVILKHRAHKHSYGA